STQFIIRQTAPGVFLPTAVQAGTRTVVNTDADPGRSAFKISESESPRPVDRCFFNYNFYGNVRFVGGVAPPTLTVIGTESFGPFVPGQPLPPRAFPTPLPLLPSPPSFPPRPVR